MVVVSHPLVFPAPDALIHIFRLKLWTWRLADDCHCIAFERMFTLSVWSCPKFTFESTSPRPRIEITHCMLLLPFLFLFLVALYKKCFFYPYLVTAGVQWSFVKPFNGPDSALEGGRLCLCLFKRYHLAWLHGRSFSLTKKRFLHACSLYHMASSMAWNRDLPKKFAT